MYTGCSELFDYRRPTDKQPILPQTHPALQAAEKVIFPEGYGLQAVRKYFAMNSALAAEGTVFPLYTHYAVLLRLPETSFSFR
jgi:hypothetical protein